MTTWKRIESSKTAVKNATLYINRDEKGYRKLEVVGENPGLIEKDNNGYYPLTAENAKFLRSNLPFLNPTPLKLHTSAGAGDRLGLATPGHIEAFRGKNIAPVFAQQSVREVIRTKRSHQRIMDDAMWGVLEKGWRDPWGADADHLKTPEELDAYADAGFTFYTIDPGAHVRNVKNAEEARAVLESSETDAAALKTKADASIKRFQQIDFPESFLRPDDSQILTAFVKYGNAIEHVKMMYDYLLKRMGDKPFDFEVSVDETDLPTNPFEHFYIASELKHLGVKFTSLAPRFIGRFEKGVDYIGDLEEFEAQYKSHADVQKYFGDYKMSIHSGSDKFAIYEICSRLSDNAIHLKTAGTSYLEALRVIAMHEPALFRDILAMSLDHYETDKQSYHVSADTRKVADSTTVKDKDLPKYLDQFDARQVLHVCFGTILGQYDPQIKECLINNHETYEIVLKTHFEKHLKPFAR